MSSSTRDAGRWLALFFVVVGCSTDEGVGRPVQSAHDRPAPSAAPPLPSATAVAPPAAPPAPRRDPLRQSAEPTDCGKPSPNPHGLPGPLQRRDASCKACPQAPASVPVCQLGDRNAVTSIKSLSAHFDKNVRLQGTVALTPVFCTKRGGECACNNRCSGALQLTLPSEPSAPVTLASQGELMGCAGDEGSVCCPFELDPKTRSLAVIASGRLSRSTDLDGAHDLERAPRLELEKLCRLK